MSSFEELEQEFGGISPQDNFEELEQEFGGISAPEEEFGVPDYLAPIARGATFGFGDEIAAGAAAGLAGLSGENPWVSD